MPGKAWQKKREETKEKEEKLRKESQSGRVVEINGHLFLLFFFL